MEGGNEVALYAIHRSLITWHDSNLNVLACAHVCINITIAVPRKVLPYARAHVDTLPNIDSIVRNFAIISRNWICKDNVASRSIDRGIAES